MTTITATLLSYYHTCQRKLWLHANSITMEHNSDVVYEGKLIGETSYPDRANKGTQLELTVPLDEVWTGTAKIDYYDAKTKTVHETKKSDKMEHAHIAQVKFYLYLLGKSGIEGATGIVEYPKLRERTAVAFTAVDHAEMERWISEIRDILDSEKCPALIYKPICKQCAYYEFCYADEIEPN